MASGMLFQDLVPGYLTDLKLLFDVKVSTLTSFIILSFSFTNQRFLVNSTSLPEE